MKRKAGFGLILAVAVSLLLAAVKNKKFTEEDKHLRILKITIDYMTTI